MASYNLWVVTGGIKNEITGEPHLHYYSTSHEEAQAMGWIFHELSQGTTIIEYHEDVEEATSIICCSECDDARIAWANATLAEWIGKPIPGKLGKPEPA